MNLTSIAQDVGITSAGSFDNNGTSQFDGAVTFTTISDLGTVTTGEVTATHVTYAAFDKATLTTTDINGGSIDGVQVGGATATGSLFVNDANDSIAPLGSQGTSGQYLQSAGSGANPTWADVSGTYSYTLFHWGSSGGDYSLANVGFYAGTDQTIADPTVNYMYWGVLSQNVYYTIFQGKYKHSDDVSTITFWARIWVDGMENAVAQVIVDEGGGSEVSGAATGTANQATPEWKSGTVDVSGLTDGTVYALTVKLKNDRADGVGVAYIDEIWGFGG